MSCEHINTTRFAPPGAFTKVYKDECCQCFDSQDLAEGIDVCLTCFNGGCVSTERHHAKLHFDKTSHPLVVNIRRVEKSKRDDGTPPPQKMTKLAIVPENYEPTYEYITKVRCYACQGIEAPKDVNQEVNITSIVDAVLAATSSSTQSDIKAWEEDITACEHTLCMQQEAPKKLEQQSLAHCAMCDLKENLWLCLTCGHLSCGRRHYDGSGGNNHAVQHFEQTGHAVACKLGTITPEGTADIYCYSCDDAKLDDQLASRLANWGINVLDQSKTEKSMTELQLEQNMKFDFSMTTEDGKHLEPKFGPGYTGIKNLGNSCYMASVLQSVFDIPEFQQRYGASLEQHAASCAVEEPANCWHCQLHKMADGLLCGRYSQPKHAETDSGVPSQDGIAPTMLKSLIGKGHQEFSTMRQQDAFEFFQYLCKFISQKEHAATKDQDPTRLFQFTTESRLQCQSCQKVRYQIDDTNSISLNIPDRPLASNPASTAPQEAAYEPVDFYECLDLFISNEVVEGYNCPQCQTKTTAQRSVKFKTVPDVLVIHARRFAFIDWVPQKLNIKVNFPTGKIHLEKYMGHGLQSGEEELPEDKAPEPTVDSNALEQLMAMGFGENRCKRALLKTGNNGAEVAMNWLFEHMEDPDIDDPVTSGKPAPTEANAEQVASLMEMGFSAAQVKKALRETDNNTERALDWLFSHPDDQGDEGSSTTEQHAIGHNHPPFDFAVKAFVSHKGTSVHCGHYVAHVLKDGQWILYNDNKVAVSVDPPVGEGYLYFLHKQ
ncbi:ubiquitin carboxyl-terminal hydrolase 14 [Hesseltinella vesiculosa]|uniref:Ubiquitin carboxyl-terminal hydrolase 14 n=1 Tax=Hesseltinella vesiculosa TaxID=101127 RepID=A0A1X2GS75_9FUNG|nr:ubiquitin carboxyl-terminal hydrolase 14 [Hesseltinella vesiculosa]